LRAQGLFMPKTSTNGLVYCGKAYWIPAFAGMTATLLAFLSAQNTNVIFFFKDLSIFLHLVVFLL
jgi:hypothetical protein